MNEVKADLPAHRFLLDLDQQDYETFEKLMSEPKVTVYFPKDDNEDFFVTNPDGTITRVARCININGIQFFIPCQVKYEVPLSVYERILESQNDANGRVAILPCGLPPAIGGENINLTAYRGA